MGLKYILTTVYSPIKTFEMIKTEKPSLVDSILMFVFVYILLLGTAYVALSLVDVQYGMDQFIFIFAGVQSTLFLKEPSVGNFFMSVMIALIDILILTGIVHIIAKKAGGKGSFSSLLMMFSMTQVVSIISVFAFLSLQNIMNSSSFMFAIPFFSVVIGIYLWRLALYFVGIRTTYKSSTEMTFMILIVSYIIFSIISVWLISSVAKNDLIQTFIEVEGIRPLDIIRG